MTVLAIVAVGALTDLTAVAYLALCAFIGHTVGRWMNGD